MFHAPAVKSHRPINSQPLVFASGHSPHPWSLPSVLTPGPFAFLDGFIVGGAVGGRCHGLNPQLLRVPCESRRPSVTHFIQFKFQSAKWLSSPASCS